MNGGLFGVKWAIGSCVSWLLMNNTSNNNDGTFDGAVFATAIKSKVETIAKRDNAWATDQQTEILTYGIEVWADTDPALNVENIRPFIRAFANMGAVWNNLKKAQLITPDESKPKTKNLFI